MFYKYLQEVERNRKKIDKQENIPLEISIEECPNNPKEDFFEAYEPQDNDGFLFEFL